MKRSDARLQLLWGLLIAVLILVHTSVQSSSLHLHLNSGPHHHHDEGDHFHDHTHAHGSFITDGVEHQQQSVEMEFTQQLLLKKVQSDSMLIVLGVFLFLILSVRVATRIRWLYQPVPLSSLSTIRPPPRAPPEKLF